MRPFLLRASVSVAEPSSSLLLPCIHPWERNRSTSKMANGNPIRQKRPAMHRRWATTVIPVDIAHRGRAGRSYDFLE